MYKKRVERSLTAGLSRRHFLQTALGAGTILACSASMALLPMSTLNPGIKQPLGSRRAAVYGGDDRAHGRRSRYLPTCPG